MDTEILREWLFITPEGALAVIISTAAMYFLFLAVSRMLGARIMTGLTSFDVSAGLIAGSIIGRSTLGPGPTLSAGIIAFLTIIALQGTVGQIAHSKRGEHFINNKPVLLVAGNKVLWDIMKRNRISRDELHAKMRMAGIQSTDEVAAVILEPTGVISVLKSDRLIDHGFIDDVVGRELIPRNLVRWTHKAGQI